MPIINPVLKNPSNIAQNPQGYTNSVIQTLISVLLIFGIVYFVYHFILAGYHMISSQGDPKKYEEAKHSLLYSIIGVIIILSVFVLLKAIGTIFGIQDLGNLKITWPSL